MINKIMNLIARILEMHNIRAKAINASEQPQEIIMLFAPDENTHHLTKFLAKCEIPYELETDEQLTSLCIFFDSIISLFEFII